MKDLCGIGTSVPLSQCFLMWPVTGFGRAVPVRESEAADHSDAVKSSDEIIDDLMGWLKSYVRGVRCDGAAAVEHIGVLCCNLKERFGSIHVSCQPSK